MKQTQKLDELIKKIIKEELDEKKISFVTPDGTDNVLTTAQRDELKKAKPGDSISFKKAGSSMQEENEEEMEVADTEVLENAPKASEIAGQVSEILEKLKAMAEGGDDPKKQKHAAKVMKAMEAAKTALEAFTAHEAMLEEKEREAENKDGEKHLKAIEKHLGKLIKDKDAVGKIMKKMPVEKVVQMKKQAGKELDEEKLAKVMLKHSLKEGWVKKN